MSKPANNARARGSKPGTLKRLVKMLFSFYPVLLPLVMLGVVLCALINSIGSVLPAEGPRGHLDLLADRRLGRSAARRSWAS